MVRGSSVQYPNFNPRPPRGGRPWAALQGKAKVEFQSTPPARGATLPPMREVFFMEFQSTPPARGATCEDMREQLVARPHFNPRPPRGGRPLGMFWMWNKERDISIHAPREGGDRGFAIFSQLLRISIHAPREGGDCCLGRSDNLSRYFNPRPPRGGRLWIQWMLCDSKGISIHAPREGGDGRNYQKQAISFISIHAPRKGGDHDTKDTPP